MFAQTLTCECCCLQTRPLRPTTAPVRALLTQIQLHTAGNAPSSPPNQSVLGWISTTLEATCPHSVCLHTADESLTLSLMGVVTVRVCKPSPATLACHSSQQILRCKFCTTCPWTPSKHGRPCCSVSLKSLIRAASQGHGRQPPL